MISRVPTQPRTLTRSIVIPQRRVLTNAVQPPRPNGRNGIKLRLFLLAASILIAYEGHECFKMFSEHYEPGYVYHSLKPLQPEEERTQILENIHRGDDAHKDE